MTPADKPDQTHAGDAGRDGFSQNDFLELRNALLSGTEAQIKALLSNNYNVILAALARRAPALGDADAAWAEAQKRGGFATMWQAFRAGHAANAGGTSDAVATVERLRDDYAPREGKSQNYELGFFDACQLVIARLRALPAPAPTDPEPAQPDRDAVVEAPHPKWCPCTQCHPSSPNDPPGPSRPPTTPKPRVA